MSEFEFHWPELVSIRVLFFGCRKIGLLPSEKPITEQEAVAFVLYAKKKGLRGYVKTRSRKFSICFRESIIFEILAWFSIELQLFAAFRSVHTTLRVCVAMCYRSTIFHVVPRGSDGIGLRSFQLTGL